MDAEEQWTKDRVTLRRSVRRRWWMIGLGVLLLVGGRALDYLHLPFQAIVAVLAAAVIANLLVGVAIRSGWYRWWLVPAVALLDVLLVSALVGFYGPVGLSAGYYLSVLPYVFERDRSWATS
jgi:hypothetical protein